MKREVKTKSLKKTVVYFLLMMAFCFVCGVVIGVLGESASERLDFHSLSERLFLVAKQATPYVMAGLLLVSTAICAALYEKARRGYARWDGEDETLIDRCEMWLSYGVLISNISYGCIMLAFSVSMHVFLHAEDLRNVSCLVPLLLFMLGLVITVLFQRAYVQLEKRMNPSMHGEVLDIHFQREWDASMDEAQKQIVGRASYKVFRVLNVTCLVLWLVGEVADQLMGTGLLPSLFVILIWMISMVTYSLEERKLEKGRR